MADQPQEQPPHGPSQEWNQISAREIEDTISTAADLAYELAGDIGQAKTPAPHRDASGLEPIETTLDAELKQLDHLVRKTQQELTDKPPSAQKKAAAVPDFMAEFLTDEPVAVMPEPPLTSGADGDGGKAIETHQARSSQSTTATAPRPQPEAKLGLVGVGSLGDRWGRKSEAETPQSEESAFKPAPPTLTGKLERLAYLGCCGFILALEMLDLPLTGLSASTRRALGVTAVAAFFTCLAMFVLSLLFS